jgi:hypothetical protein
MNRSSQRTKHNTYSYEFDPEFITVTHPYHPLRGQRLEVLRAGKGSSVLVNLEGGGSLEIPLDYTDYVIDTPAGGQDSSNPAADLHSVDALRRIITAVNQIKSKGTGT